jgi:hypothetical protein
MRTLLRRMEALEASGSGADHGWHLDRLTDAELERLDVICAANEAGEPLSLSASDEAMIIKCRPDE